MRGRLPTSPLAPRHVDSSVSLSLAQRLYVCVSVYVCVRVCTQHRVHVSRSCPPTCVHVHVHTRVHVCTQGAARMVYLWSI